MAKLKTEIEQRLPFESLEEEALLNLLRSADHLERALQQTTRHWGVTLTQYNVLRILRGAGPQGLTCSAIGRRMIAAEPDITRLLLRLKTMKLVEQRRDDYDKRAVWTAITPLGLERLEAMEATVRAAPKQLLGRLGEEELRAFIGLLERAREGEQAAPTPTAK
jgi:DNA-binding MarR family transcriptional regulator